MLRKNSYYWEKLGVTRLNGQLVSDGTQEDEIF